MLAGRRPPLKPATEDGNAAIARSRPAPSPTAWDRRDFPVDSTGVNLMRFGRRHLIGRIAAGGGIAVRIPASLSRLRGVFGRDQARGSREPPIEAGHRNGVSRVRARVVAWIGWLRPIEVRQFQCG